MEDDGWYGNQKKHDLIDLSDISTTPQYVRPEMTYYFEVESKGGDKYWRVQYWYSKYTV